MGAHCPQETGWYHDMVGIFAGALRCTHYGFVKRYLMKRAQEIRAAPTPTPRMTTTTLTGTTSGTPSRSSWKCCPLSANAGTSTQERKGDVLVPIKNKLTLA
jgi:hypothetical protein